MKLFNNLSSCALALIFGGAAAAQTTVDIPISADIIVPTLSLEVEVLQGANLGSVARSSEARCTYRVRSDGEPAEWLEALDASGGDFNAGNTFGKLGCGSIGTGQLAKLRLSCVTGTAVELAHRGTTYVDEYTDASLGEISAEGVTSEGYWQGAEYITFMPCTSSDGGLISVMELSAEAYLVLHRHHSPTEQRLDISMPLEVRY